MLDTNRGNIVYSCKLGSILLSALFLLAFTSPHLVLMESIEEDKSNVIALVCVSRNTTVKLEIKIHVLIFCFLKQIFTTNNGLDYMKMLGRQKYHPPLPEQQS